MERTAKSWIFLIQLLLTTVYSEDVKTTCFDTVVNKDEKATLTFYFSKNISLQHYSIRIKHFVSQRDENVLTCHWLETVECDIRPTFSFDGIITNKVSIDIPHVTESHVGRYACFVVPSPPDSYQMCNLTLKGETTPDTLMYTKSGIAQVSEIKQIHQEQLHWSMQDSQFVIAIANLVGILCIVGISLVIVIMRCIGKRRNKPVSNPNELHDMTVPLRFKIENSPLIQDIHLSFTGQEVTIPLNIRVENPNSNKDNGNASIKTG